MNDRRGTLVESLYNPHRLDRETLVRTFTARHATLEEVLRGLRAHEPPGASQHWMLTGSRGMGKTTLLLRLRHAIDAEAELSRVWEPVTFPEENYNVGDLAELWLTTLRAIGATTGDAGPIETAEKLLAPEPPYELLEAQALEALRARVRRTGRRLVLLLDNLDRLLDQIADDRQQYRLRGILMEDTSFLVIGTAVGRPVSMSAYDQPFYEFFRELRLRGLSGEEMLTSLRTRAEVLGDKRVLDSMQRSPGRVEGLRRLTGGTPRLGLMMYRLFRDAPRGSLREDLDQLLEEATPGYRERLEALPEQGRRVFDAVARSWDPVLARDVARRTRLPVTTVSTQLARLVDRGYVEEAAGAATRKEFQVAERFLNLHYVLRFDPLGRARLWRLARFMEAFYGAGSRVESSPAEAKPVAWTTALAHADRLLRTLAGKLVEAEPKALRPLLGPIGDLARSGHAKEAARLLDEHGASDAFEPLRHALAVESGEDVHRLRRVALEMAGVAQDVLATFRASTKASP